MHLTTHSVHCVGEPTLASMVLPAGECSVNKRKLEAEVERIEETQDALRASIEQTRLLAERADKLLQQHKATLDEADQSGD